MNSAQVIDELPEIAKLKQKIGSVQLPPDLLEKANSMISRVSVGLKYSGQLNNLDQVTNYIDWITSLPWYVRSDEKVDLIKAASILDTHHYGLKQIKDRILEYLSVMILNNNQSGDSGSVGKSLMRAPILFFVGLVGTGKTTMAISTAKALGRPFVRIPFGGMGSALDLRGESRVHPDAEVGLIMKALKRAKVKNPVILLDELDRVSEHARADIMGVLVELLDPEQNSAFVDHYIDFPFDLSEVLFIATANNTNNISTAVMDRLEPIQMPSYSDEEKIVIGKSFVFPTALKTAGITSTQLMIDDDVWQSVTRPLGFDSGIRTLERTIEGICRKVARMLVEGKGTSFRITPENVKQYLPTW